MYIYIYIYTYTYTCIYTYTHVFSRDQRLPPLRPRFARRRGEAAPRPIIISCIRRLIVIKLLLHCNTMLYCYYFTITVIKLLYCCYYNMTVIKLLYCYHCAIVPLETRLREAAMLRFVSVVMIVSCICTGISITYY